MNSMTHFSQYVILVAVLVIANNINAAEEKGGLVYDFTPDQQKATLYIYREWSFVSGGVDLLGFLDDLPLGNMDNGFVIKVATTPGIHDLWSDMGLHNQILRSHKELNLQKGKNYFLGVNVSELRDAFFEMDESAARELMTEMSADKRHVVDLTSSN